jgi:hypothetical protein
MRRHKVRLDDGSEIDLDVQAIKDWYAQGLLKRDSPVLKPGAKQWLPLNRALDLPSGRREAAEARARVVEAEAEAETAAPRPAWPLRLAGALLLCAAAGAAFFWWQPWRWLADLEETPWRHVALGLSAAGLLLLPGWPFTRLVVRILALVAALLAPPAAVILAVQGLRFGPAYIVLGSAAAALLGIFVLLGGASWQRTLLSLLLVLGGGFGIHRYGLVTESDEERKVREALLPDAAWTDASLGVRLELPAGWRRLRPDQTAVAVPAEARIVLARPRQGGFAYLSAEAGPRGVLRLEDHLERAVRARSGAAPELAAAGRHATTVGGLSGLGVNAFRTAGGRRMGETCVVWRHGFAWFTLVAWASDEVRGGAVRPLDALRTAIGHTPEPAQRLAQAVESASRDLPLVSPAAAELVIRALGRPPEAPEAVLRESLRLAALGRGTLSVDETADLASLTDAVAAALAPKERPGLVAYLQGGAEGPASEEDRQMAPLLKRALLQLPSDRLARLQDLYAKAIAAGMRAGP